MKTNITITIDQEIVEELKREVNYSSLINEQLKAYYATKHCENEAILQQKLKETKQILTENRRKRREYEAQLRKIAEKKKKVKDFFKKKQYNKAKLIKKIEEKRRIENSMEGRKVIYSISVEEEAEKILKGGEDNVGL